MGKGKKKSRRDDDDDWEAEMEALNNEVAGTIEPEAETAPAAAKAGFAALAVSDDEEDAAAAAVSEDEAPKGKKGGKAADVDEDDNDGDEAAAVSTMKTAAQKKAEKKERERREKEKKKEKERKKKEKKKQDQAAQEAKKQQEAAELDNLLEEQGLAPTKADAPETSAAAATDDNKADKADADEGKDDNGNDDDDDANEDGDDGDDGGSSKKKNKKKKKKKAAAEKEEEPAKSKKPVSKMAAKLKAQQEARRLEEERIAREIEEKKRELEEELRRQEEAEREEEERRQRKKQKEAERKARLRAEGKLLSKAEKERQRMAREKLEQMKALGMEVEALQDPEAQRKRPVYTKKKKQHKSTSSDAPSTPAADKTTADDTPASPAPSSPKAEENEPEVDSWEEAAADLVPDEPEAVADDWDASESEDEQGDNADKKAAQPTKAKAAVATQSKVADKADAADAAEDSASDSEGSDDDESDSGSDGSDSDESDEEIEGELSLQEIKRRIAKRKADADAKKDLEVLRSPIVAVLGHVDTGKTKILDKIRRTNVQDGEAGGITQQIGSTYVPCEEIQRQSKTLKKAQGFDFNVPGLLVIDTPGHEAFSNLRSRGSSLCNIAILVVDIMHGIEPQTAESIELLRRRKAPFIIALNKVDRLNGWVPSPNAAIQNSLKKQKPHTMQDFETRWNQVKVQFAEKSLNVDLWYNNKNMKEFVNVVPTSAHTGEGIPDLLFMIVYLSQKMLARDIAFSEELECTVLEVKTIQGYGTTVDAILANGHIREGDTIVVSGLEGPIVTTVRSLLMPAPMKDLRVKNAYTTNKEVKAAQGIKIAAKDLEKAVAGLPLAVARHAYELPYLKAEAEANLAATLNAIKTVDEGVVVQASTLGSLEALMTFLNSEKIPVSAVNIGPVYKRDVFRASIQLERNPKYAMILAFDVPIDREAQAMADKEGIKIFSADIIYHLEERFREHMEEVKQRLREQFKFVAVFPCRLRILPEHIFNARDPIVVGVHVEEGVVREGTPLVIPGKEFLEIGVIASLEFDNKTVDLAYKGQDICIKIQPTGAEKRMYGRHFDHTDELVSKISRESINACKDHFRDDLKKDDWKLMVKLKKLFQIL